jgi:hypothetical protein
MPSSAHAFSSPCHPADEIFLGHLLFDAHWDKKCAIEVEYLRAGGLSRRPEPGLLREGSWIGLWFEVSGAEDGTLSHAILAEWIGFGPLGATVTSLVRTRRRGAAFLKR